jgi:hypothetical protein
MNGEVLIQNIVNIFIIAVILEASIMAIFSMSVIKDLEKNRAIEATRDAIIIIAAFIICYKVTTLRVFLKTGVKIPVLIDIIISTLVLARMTNLIRTLMSRFKTED